jgi:hypothetical protein
MAEETLSDDLRESLLSNVKFGKLPTPPKKETPVIPEPSIVLPELTLTTDSDKKNVPFVKPNPVLGEVTTIKEITLDQLSSWVLEAIKENDLKSISAIECNALVNSLHKKINSLSSSSTKKTENQPVAESMVDKLLKARQNNPDTELANVSKEDRKELLEKLNFNKRKLVDLFRKA